MIAELILNNVFNTLSLYQFIATVVTYSILRGAIFLNVRKRRYQLLADYGIPGPTPRLLDGNLKEYTSTKTPYLVDLERQRKYGKVHCFHIGDQPSIVVSDLELLRKIFFEKQSSFKERSVTFLDSPISKSLLFAPHDRWRAMRKIIAPTFSQFSMRGQASTQFIEDSIKLMLNYIDSKFNEQARHNTSNKSNQEPIRIAFDIQSLMKATALKLITGLAINLPDVQVNEDDTYVESLDSFLSNADSGAVLWIIRFPFLKKLLEFVADRIEHGKFMSSVRRVLNTSIDDGLKRLALSEDPKVGTGSSDMPQLKETLIKLHYEGKLSREEVIGNCEAILFAGYDTTSTTLAYIFWVLGKYPEIQDKLRSDLMAHGTESEYLQQVINEVMRLYPTVLTFTTRLATENVQVDDLIIPSGTRVVMNNWLMHRDPEYWPEPEKFDPERFRKGAQIHPCAFAPFGLGERKCIGYSLAQLELKMVTCDLVCRYRIYTIAPNELTLYNYATVLSKPSEKISIELERIRG